MFRIHRSQTMKIFVAVGGALLSLTIIIVVTAFSASGMMPTVPSTKLPERFVNPNYPFPTDAYIGPTAAASVHRLATERVQAATRLARNPPQRHGPPTDEPTRPQPGNVVGIIAGPLPWEYGPAFRADAVVENFYRTWVPPGHDLFLVLAGAARRRAAGIRGRGNDLWQQKRADCEQQVLDTDEARQRACHGGEWHEGDACGDGRHDLHLR